MKTLMAGSVQLNYTLRLGQHRITCSTGGKNKFEECANLKMHSIILKPLYHRGQENVAIYYKHEAEINLIVRKLPSGQPCGLLTLRA